MIGSQYKAAIFDLDGTLIDSSFDLNDSINELLSLYGRPPVAWEKCRYMVGNGSRLFVERALPDFSAEEILAALEEYKKIYAKRVTRKTKPYAGIAELLAGLKAGGRKIAVCTNKHQSAATSVVGKLFSPDTFDLVVGERPGLAKKPDPEMALFIAETFAVRPSEVIYFGDTAIDMETAKRAGFLPVGVLWGFRDKKELVAGGAKILLSRPEELWQHMGENPLSASGAESDDKNTEKKS